MQLSSQKLEIHKFSSIHDRIGHTIMEHVTIKLMD